MTTETAEPVTPLRITIEGDLPMSTIRVMQGLLHTYPCEVSIVEMVLGEPVADGQQRALAGLVAADEPITSIELAARVGIPRGSVRSYCARLVKAGLATRLYGKARNSESRFVATDAGRQLVAAHRPV
ncbi:hypothetical protein SE17_24650 [Kouleothrix aurantiaca]|uniref:Uncharacterized protein n=1 Tax=Kouleothrix aurantiaca TaxID=186479 RepID=A0A0P9DLG6_9CHLR|nr:hypothetical protein SE17_24650 [Kouleothrix aurantiaca]